MTEQQELAQSSALLLLQPEFQESRAGWQHPGSSASPLPLSPPCHVPPGSRPALGLCCSVLGWEDPPGCVCWAGTPQCCLCFPRTRLSAQVLVTSPWKNPLGVNLKEWCWFPPHVKNEVFYIPGFQAVGEYGC